MKYITIPLLIACAFSALAERPKTNPKPEIGQPNKSDPVEEYRNLEKVLAGNKAHSAKAERDLQVKIAEANKNHQNGQTDRRELAIHVENLLAEHDAAMKGHERETKHIESRLAELKEIPEVAICIFPPKPEPKKFPPHWGRPPAVQTKDFKKLPLGFGMGSSTLAKWILANVKKDKARPPRPDKPKPSPEIQAKIEILQEKKKEMNEQRNKLRVELKGKSKEDVIELIKAFKAANKEKHQAIKEAHKSLAEEVRSKRQTGSKRE